MMVAASLVAGKILKETYNIVSSASIEIFGLTVSLQRRTKSSNNRINSKLVGIGAPLCLCFRVMKRTIAVLTELTPFSQIKVRELFRMAHRHGRKVKFLRKPSN
jgi:hypothetical protein